MNHCHLGPHHCRACKNQRYGWAHQKRRAAWAPLVATGTVACARCGQPIAAGQAWDLDHVAGTTHPSHATCNRGSTTRSGQAQGGSGRPW